MGLIDIAKKHIKDVKLDQENLDLLNLNVRKDQAKSRLVVTVTSELGVDFPGDTVENVIATIANTALGNS